MKAIIITQSTNDSDLHFLQRAKLLNIASASCNLQVNRIREKPCVLRVMFWKLDVRRKSIVTLALS